MPKSLVKAEGFLFASFAGTVDLVHSYFAALTNSGADVLKDIGLWFDRSWPTGGLSDEELKHTNMFFVEIAVLIKPLVKMARIGVLVRVLFSLVIG